jgi:hypothetical protein
MMKKVLLATLAVFVAWGALDYVIHNLILSSSYTATAHLWRPDGEMKMGLMIFASLVSTFFFVFIYARFFGEKGMKTGLMYGLLFGIGMGIGFGYGSYSVMPIPYNMALTWFLGTVVEGTVGGIITGAIINK